MQVNNLIVPEARRIGRNCVHMRMRLLNRVLSKLYDDALRPLGVKSSQFNILVAVGNIGLASPADLALTLQLDQSTISRNVERMRARGWLEAVGADDGRARPFRLTAAGADLIRDAVPAWQKAQDEAADLLGKGRCEAVCDAAESIRRRAMKQ